MIDISNHHETVSGPSRKTFICVYKWLYQRRNNNLYINKEVTSISLIADTYVSDWRVTSACISWSLCLHLKMMGHLCLDHRLFVILNLYILNYFLDILSNWGIIRISGPFSSSSRSSMSDNVGCLKLLGRHPLLVRTGWDYSSYRTCVSSMSYSLAWSLVVVVVALSCCLEAIVPFVPLVLIGNKKNIEIWTIKFFKNLEKTSIFFEMFG